MEISYYAPRRVVRTDYSETIVSSNDMYSTLIRRKCEVYIILEVKEYVTPVVYISQLTKTSNISNLTLEVSKCNNTTLSKFKAIKFILE